MSQEKLNLFLERAKKIHGDIYDYSKTIYYMANSKLIIICKIHGEFLKSPVNHLRGQGCPLCGYHNGASSKRETTESFISKAKEIHGDLFDYSKAKYGKNQSQKLIIICRLHGEFLQSPVSHLSGNGCKRCAMDRRKIISKLNKRSNEFYINKSKKIYGDKYDYSEFNYIDQKHKIILICKLHGRFSQWPGSHFEGSEGCKECDNIRKKIAYRSNTKEFIAKSNIVHNNRYNYDKTIYIECRQKVIITCPKHGDFMQRPDSHLDGRGCPCCNVSIGEEIVRRVLQKLNISFEEQKTFPTCRYIRLLRWDFWIPSLNLLIEFDGIQHFPNEVKFKYKFDFSDQYDQIKLRDEFKTKWAEEYQVNLLRIKYDDDVEKVIQEYLDFLKS